MTASPRLRPILVALAVSALLAGCNSATSPQASGAAVLASGTKVAQLRKALAAADRMTIAPTTSTNGSTPTVRDLQGADTIAEFLDQAEIDETYGPVRCGAPDDAVYTFYAGEKVVATLNLRRLGYLSWAGGTWNGDAVLTAGGSQKLLLWSRAAGADISGAIQRLATASVQRNTQARQRFLAAFTPTARAAFAQADSIVYESRQVRRVETTLNDDYDSKNALADTSFRALAESPIRWMEDDWGTGALENVLMEMDPAVVRASMGRLQGDEDVMLGVARFYFRADFQMKMEAADRDAWTERLADLALRKGRNTNKHAVLEFLSAMSGEGPAAFLRAVALGQKAYPYSPAYDDVSLDTEEPALADAAALLLAMRGDAKAAEILRTLKRKPAFGPDQAARDVADALLSKDVQVKPATFIYHSRVLGIAAIEVLKRRSASAITIDVLSAALQHTAPDVATTASKLAMLNQMRRSTEPPDPSLLTMNFDSLLAESYPRLAVEQYSALIPKAMGQTLARLQELRAQAYYNLGDYANCEIDYLNVAKTPYVENTDVLTRLSWVQWYLGETGVAEQTIARALVDDPKSDLVLLRGIMRYGQNDFRPATESDLIAATVLDPTDGYAVLFQHLVATLGGRPTESHLKASLAATEIPEWPRQIIGFMLGTVPSARLLELAVSGDVNDVAWHLCEANFYISQAARIAGKTDDERKYLADCVALNQPHVAEFWVAKSRLAEIRPGSAPLPRAARPSSI